MLWRGRVRTGIEVVTPMPRKARVSKPWTPSSKRVTARSPPSEYLIFSSGAVARYSRSCGGTIKRFGVTW